MIRRRQGEVTIIDLYSLENDEEKDIEEELCSLIILKNESTVG